MSAENEKLNALANDVLKLWKPDKPDGRAHCAVASGSAVDAALAWVEADPLDNAACDAGHRAMHALPGVRAWWPCNSAPPHVLDNAASQILAVEVRRLRALLLNTQR